MMKWDERGLVKWLYFSAFTSYDLIILIAEVHSRFHFRILWTIFCKPYIVLYTAHCTLKTSSLKISSTV